MGKNLETIRKDARHGKAVSRNARVARYSSSHKPKAMEATRLTPDLETARRNRARQSLEQAQAEQKAKRTKRHGTVTEAKMLYANDDGSVTVLLKVWGMRERFTQKMEHRDYVSLSSSI